MSKNWYPVIDYLVCTKCGLCVKKCAHGVYNGCCGCGGDC